MYGGRNAHASTHTHSLGEVVSHIAQTYAEAWWTVMHSANVELRLQAWFHLGEAREGSAEMVNEIQARISSCRWEPAEYPALATPGYVHLEVGVLSTLAARQRCRWRNTTA